MHRCPKLLLALYSIAMIAFYLCDEDAIGIGFDKLHVRNLTVHKLCHGNLSGVNYLVLIALLGAPAAAYQRGGLVVFVYNIAGDYKEIEARRVENAEYREKHPDLIMPVPAACIPDARFWYFEIADGSVIRSWSQYHDMYSL